MDRRFSLDHRAAHHLASEFGTPLYVMDEATLRSHAKETCAALPGVVISYASKANSTLAVLQVLRSEGCLMDAASIGEAEAGLRAGYDGTEITFHGNAKTKEDLLFAKERGIGTIVVDCDDEVELLHRLGMTSVKVMIRVKPDMPTFTHIKISTGDEESKFGVSIVNRDAERLALRCRELGLNLEGFHVHMGSNLRQPGVQRDGAVAMCEFAVRMKQEHGLESKVLNLGGGYAAQYLDDQEITSPELYYADLLKAVRAVLLPAGMSPQLVVEPGRSLVAESGVTLYRVVVRKEVGHRTILAVDGGLSDNPSPALYDRRFKLRLCRRSDTGNHRFTVVGRHCETDELFPDIELPGDTGPGDLVQVLSTGAYNQSMASNYNRFPRPAAVLLRPAAVMIQRREDVDDLFRTEALLPGELQ